MDKPYKQATSLRRAVGTAGVLGAVVLGLVPQGMASAQTARTMACAQTSPSARARACVTTGPQGIAGPQGVAGPQGIAGPQGASSSAGRPSAPAAENTPSATSPRYFFVKYIARGKTMKGTKEYLSVQDLAGRTATHSAKTFTSKLSLSASVHLIGHASPKALGFCQFTLDQYKSNKVTVVGKGPKVTWAIPARDEARVYMYSDQTLSYTPTVAGASYSTRLALSCGASTKSDAALVSAHLKATTISTGTRTAGAARMPANSFSSKR